MEHPRWYIHGCSESGVSDGKRRGRKKQYLPGEMTWVYRLVLRLSELVILVLTGRSSLQRICLDEITATFLYSENILQHPLEVSVNNRIVESFNTDKGKEQYSANR